MSHTAHIPSHRKPRRGNATKLRAGVAGGVLSTLAVAGSAGSASAAEPVTETIELPTLSSDLSVQVARSASATQLTAATYELQAQQEQVEAERDAATEKAAKQAKKDRDEAVRKAEAKKAEERAAAEAERKAEERASRTSDERTALATASAPAAGGSSGSSDSGNSSGSGSAGSGNSSSSGNQQGAATPSSGNLNAVIAFLKAQVGDAYVMGATGPSSWDCSGLVQAAFKQANINLPRTSQQQSTAGTQVGTSNLQVGDILYWGGAGSAYHTGVYIGNGQYLDAANPAKGVVIQDLSGYPADGAVRVL
ncbi:MULTISPECIES: C40 family peptidase [unclassified Streptomyces]|uniref:C40 family peptidase n=1 Tax=Streptomyces sp. NPDC005955 TaxID=3364738 RepID=UPI003679B288